MLLNKLSVVNSRGSTLELPLEDSSGGFVVQEILGLDPVKANLVSSSFAGMDGEQYHSSRRDPRNIKIKLGLSPDWSISDVKALRDTLYQYFMPKSNPKFIFRMYDKYATDVFSEFLDLQIDGRIETFDGPLFTNDPIVDISAMCFNPDFYDPNEVIFAGNTVSDTVTNETLTYAGTVDTGTIFTLNINQAMTDLTIYHTAPDGSLTTSYFSYAFEAGDVLTISSIVGSKSVMLTRAGVQSSILYAMTPQSGWLTLQPGDNLIRAYVTGAAIPYTIQYNNKYGGL